MFHKASVRLTAVYLAIIMFISVFFSVAIYQLSVQELDKGLRTNTASIQQGLNRLPSEFRSVLQRQQQTQYEEARRRVLARLYLVNVIILAAGGILSYYLALRTLRPIEEAHASLERFTADASHELRTPITAIKTENEVALMDPKLTLKDAKGVIESNIEELNKIADLATGLLRIARQELTPGEFAHVPVKTLLTDAVSRVEPSADKKKITIKYPQKLALKVLGDETSLTEVLTILLDNAIKYSPDKTTIEVAAKKSQRMVQITVSDQGPGILPTDLPHIFDRFYRSDLARSKQTAEGYGLGLAIAQNIVTQHNGKISAKSTHGQGSTFCVELLLG